MNNAIAKLVIVSFVILTFLLLLFSADDAQLTPLLRLGAGACAGIIAMSATYPMDMVRGRLTVQVYIMVPYSFRFKGRSCCIIGLYHLSS